MKKKLDASPFGCDIYADTSGFCADRIKPADVSATVESQSSNEMFSLKQSRWLENGGDNFLTKLILQNSPGKEYFSEENCFDGETPKASRQVGESRLDNLPNEIHTVTSFKDKADDLSCTNNRMDSFMDMVASNLDCIALASTVTCGYEAYKSFKRQKVSFSKSEFNNGCTPPSSILKNYRGDISPETMLRNLAMTYQNVPSIIRKRTPRPLRQSPKPIQNHSALDN
ncbi:hypothetical protein Fmac_002064 [Flemingia macrophylla]|uniref:Uncharacterized protein n=1 Tax=Flemingia macrophylla TaxID=520843 RepID=A0ABD1NIW3_9FABA